VNGAMSERLSEDTQFICVASLKGTCSLCPARESLGHEHQDTKTQSVSYAGRENTKQGVT